MVRELVLASYLLEKYGKHRGIFSELDLLQVLIF